jgi:hypothetical protein
MADAAAVDPVKLVVFALWAEEAALRESLAAMAAAFGEIDGSGPDRPFDRTDYYRAEMGDGLSRRLVSFARLIPPEGIVGIKLECNQIERRLLGPRGRRVNLDAGYLDRGKLVLASMKFGTQKIHLGAGVWADPCGRRQRAGWTWFEWSFPDLRDGRYDPELDAARRRYLLQRKDRLTPRRTG